MYVCDAAVPLCPRHSPATTAGIMRSVCPSSLRLVGTSMHAQRLLSTNTACSSFTRTGASMRDVECEPAARRWMEEQKNNVNLLLLLHVATRLHHHHHNNNSHGVSSGKVHRGMWIVCPGQGGHRMRQQQCVGPTVIKTTPMIEHKTVAVEHLAEVSSGELADIARDGRFRAHLRTGNRRPPTTTKMLLPTLFGSHHPTPAQQQLPMPLGIVPCEPARWHRAGEALQASSPASARSADTKAREETHTSKRHHATLRTLPGVQMVHVDGASCHVEVKHETYATGPRNIIIALKDAGVRGGAGTRITTHRSEIRFCPITFIVCATVFLRRVHHRGCVRPDSWDARMIDGMSQRISSFSRCWA
ncbi:hypothetical protein PTSG_02958 [Salpingoeca rosetta]|uniref:Uncharacterized protein n=1 Tax=Salpingoeca rosetta (strain ATCC 50818 / BSB-021) TaxID=946362 RepID=F2U3U6_SALR5|nr:uncharacterized protein PTSG_02958 [Salpingoeca rosetta]EGD82290.1 hypothetical protein PTSG_02958 [Salpingoeca rosetta]|eukprot:XP_004996473.1 hypothetical protein PTSG_02958 [Salpingoeca rosetta]